MGSFPNKATQFPSGARQVETARKGGKTITDKQRRSQKLRQIKARIKKGQIKTEDEEWLLARYESKEMFGWELMSIYDEVKRNNPADKTLFHGTKLFDTIHGSKNNPQINIQANTTGNVQINIIPLKNANHKLDSKPEAVSSVRDSSEQNYD